MNILITGSSGYIGRYILNNIDRSKWKENIKSKIP